MITRKGEWLYIVSGQWRLACNVIYGGSRFDVYVPCFGWCLPQESEPSKQTARRMVRKAFRYIGA